MRRLIMLATVVAMLAMASMASAAWFTAPEGVIAQENGKYILAVSVYAGAEDVTISTEYMFGIVNSAEDRSRDLECAVTVPAGTSRTFVWEGYLDDPTMDGQVEMGTTFCGDTAPLSTIINVYRFGTVATEEGTFDSIKAMYR